MQIAILSDTHGYFDPRLDFYLQDCDEIWHLGDIGDWSVVDRLRAFGLQTRFVLGNIDPPSWQKNIPFVDFFVWGEKRFLLLHIAGAPLRYNAQTQALIRTHRPDYLLCGHSHILRVQWDAAHGLLYINPGACGQYGQHTKNTCLKVRIHPDGTLYDLRIVEWNKNEKI